MLKRIWLIVLLPLLFLAGCASLQQAVESRAEAACAVTEPEWILPPDDEAVGNAPAEGHYYVNENHTIWAAAWWYTELKEEGINVLEAGEGTKTGWFRPAGETLTITGERIDGDAPPMEASVPCCYPTRFQATGLMFPERGCWEVQAEAAGETLAFVVWVR